MYEVASHLATESKKRQKKAEKDLFARSSFNRFYYATFLAVRNEISPLDEKWENLGHASYPKLIGNTMQAEFKKNIKAARKLGDTRKVSAFSSAATAAKNLSSIMNSANACRIQADYFPENKVQFLDSDFQLGPSKLSAAKQWPSNAKILAKTVAEAWRIV
ncbi:hypothetical protein [Nisaea sp.]|uniref:hypothetical protein n=1 Tax=Nisaea sp. TaxID=2024842 RepID=UPI003265C2A2